MLKMTTSMDLIFIFRFAQNKYYPLDTRNELGRASGRMSDARSNSTAR